MGQFDRQIATAKRLIAKYGQTCIWRKVANGAPVDSLKPWKPTASETSDNNASIVFLPASRENRELLRYLKGTEIPVGSIQGLMPAVSFEPTLKDVVIRDGKQLRLKSIDPVSPNGEIILYTLEFEESGTGTTPPLDGVLNTLETVINNDLPGAF